MDLHSQIDAVGPCGMDACASPSRRSFLIGAAFISSSLFLGGCGGGDSTRGAVSPRFFEADERAFVRAAVDRLIPKDGLGVGGVDAGVDVFIDAQLAGPFGQAVGIYMQAPFHLGDQEQGYQLPFTPAQVYRLGIQRVDEHCRKALGNAFAQLKPEQQDSILHDLEDGKIDLGEIPSGDFFGLLWQNAREGFLADPIYGGNRNFAGWKLIGYNGPRYNYLDDIGNFGKPYERPYVSLGGASPVMCRLSDSPTGRFRGPGCDYARMPAKTHYDALTTTTGKVWPAGNL
jgi:gluconate 2-dehydrogenase gamma chain